jgi:hypothetical protein
VWRLPVKLPMQATSDSFAPAREEKKSGLGRDRRTFRRTDELGEVRGDMFVNLDPRATVEVIHVAQNTTVAGKSEGKVSSSSGAKDKRVRTCYSKRSALQ